MTAPARSPARPGQPHAIRGALTLAALGAAGLALGLRLALAERSFDLFGDEIIYSRLAHSVVSGWLPVLDRRPFFLHPPGFFYLAAGWQQLLGYHPATIAMVDQLRLLNAVLGAVTAAVLVLLVARASSTWAGLAAGLLFAADPFCVRQNDRVLLETAMMLWVLLGYLALSYLAGRAPSRRAWAGAVGCGVLSGLAVLTKDEAALLTVVPCAAAAALGWGAQRRLMLAAAGTPVVMYGGYAAAVAASGHGRALWEAKTTGAGRLLGFIQLTGFHAAGAPSLAARLTAEARYFGVTYAILVLGVLALVLLLRRGGPMQRVLALLHLAAAVTVGYALVIGTLEEQVLYLLLVPTLVTVPAAAASWLSGHGRAARLWPAAAGALVLAAFAFNLAACVQWLQQPDDGYARLRQYLAAHLPAGSAITAVDGTAERGVTAWALSDRYRVGRWVTPAARARAGARYLVVPWLAVRQGYSYLTPAQVRSLAGQGRLIFSIHGRTYGDLALYQLPLPPRARHAR